MGRSEAATGVAHSSDTTKKGSLTKRDSLSAAPSTGLNVGILCKPDAIKLFAEGKTMELRGKPLHRVPPGGVLYIVQSGSFWIAPDGERYWQCKYKTVFDTNVPISFSDGTSADLDKYYTEHLCTCDFLQNL
eukprot:5310620-Karenia_brevis.AAC.1